MPEPGSTSTDPSTAALRFPFPAEPAVLSGDPRDTGVFASVHATGQYEPTMARFFADHVRPDSVCLDVGANIGAHTLVMSRLASAGTVLAIEPDPDNAAHLARSIELSGISVATVAAVAAGSEPGELVLHRSDAHPGGAFIATTAAADHAAVAIPVTTIDALVDDHAIEHVDLMKIDVEGSEVEALRGAAKTLSRCKPVIVAEYNTVALWRFRRLTAGDLLDELLRHYEQIGFLDDDGQVRAVRDATHLEELASVRGLVDVVVGIEPVGDQPAGGTRDLLRRVRALAGRIKRIGRSHPAIPNQFVGVPAGRLAADRRSVDGTAGSTATVDVEISNDTDRWLTSDNPNHPVHLSYRLDGDVDGIRTRLTEPIAPHGFHRQPMDLRLPDSGTETARVSLVQEGYCWFDDLTPEMGVAVELTVD